MSKLKKLVKSTAKSLGLKQDIAATRKLVVRPVLKGQPHATVGTADAVPHPSRLQFAERLIDAYSMSMADQPNSRLKLANDDLWTGIVRSEYPQLLQILDSKDVEGLASYLIAYGKQPSGYGGLSFSIDGYHRIKNSAHVALTYVEKVVCLAESLGILTLENPEQTARWGENLYENLDNLIDKIQTHIGYDLVPVECPIAITGIETCGGLLHYRHINAVYAATRLQALAHSNDPVCEFGGGIGLVAYYANKSGLQNYTLFDLPISNVFSGHFLLSTLGPDLVNLYGEPATANAVKVLPYWRCIEAQENAFAISLNQDSFPEIDPDLVHVYFREIERMTSRYFLSINQEAQASMGKRRQNIVPLIINDYPNFYRIYRMKYWIREGYVEELYELRH